MPAVNPASPPEKSTLRLNASLNLDRWPALLRGEALRRVCPFGVRRPFAAAEMLGVREGRYLSSPFILSPVPMEESTHGGEGLRQCAPSSVGCPQRAFDDGGRKGTKVGQFSRANRAFGVPLSLFCPVACPCFGAIKCCKLLFGARSAYCPAKHDGHEAELSLRSPEKCCWRSLPNWHGTPAGLVVVRGCNTVKRAIWCGRSTPDWRCASAIGAAASTTQTTKGESNAE